MKTQNTFILRAKLFSDRIGAALFPKNIGKRKIYIQKNNRKLKSIDDSAKLEKFMRREEEKAQRIKEREGRKQEQRKRDCTFLCHRRRSPHTRSTRYVPKTRRGKGVPVGHKGSEVIIRGCSCLNCTNVAGGISTLLGWCS